MIERTTRNCALIYVEELYMLPRSVARGEGGDGGTSTAPGVFELACERWEFNTKCLPKSPYRHTFPEGPNFEARAVGRGQERTAVCATGCSTV